MPRAAQAGLVQRAPRPHDGSSPGRAAISGRLLEFRGEFEGEFGSPRIRVFRGETSEFARDVKMKFARISGLRVADVLKWSWFPKSAL